MGLLQCIYDAGDEVHHIVKGLNADVHRSPAAKEHRCGDAGDDEEVEELSQIEEAEAHT